MGSIIIDNPISSFKKTFKKYLNKTKKNNLTNIP